ncbi:carbohydrate ABC transporter permease [Nocardiopsis metallicus]|uniref:Multiple sugar transport system permease protein n=1 Tax=Nocardiopsis metallicus TaxID=179819 RepID=A0A840WJR2_9ACTN|nr:carbohydrate ABC transporter permease [Nocardiopsis metallicus]MBB5492105.1 multiple sugar transport system permease protein [Nocardiopsis metallicus]
MTTRESRAAVRRAHRPRPKTPPALVNALKLLGLLLVLGWCLFPFLWMGMTSLRTGSVALTDPNIFRGPYSLGNYEEVVNQGFHFALRNSLIVASATTLICIPVAALAGYALARLPMAGKFVLLAATLVATLFPPVALVNPLYRMYLQLNDLTGISLLNSYAGMVIPYVALTLPLSIFILATFFAGIPKEIEESAKVDGATPFQAFLKVVVPLAAPGVGAAAILTFVYATNEFLLAFSFAPRDLNVQTVPVFVGTFERVGYENPIGQIMAASVLVSVPLIVFALVLQRRIVAGLTSGAVKG